MLSAIALTRCPLDIENLTFVRSEEGIGKWKGEKSGNSENEIGEELAL